MDHFSEYAIPILGLRDGQYPFEYVLDSKFFARFEGAPISDAHFDVQVQLDKRTSILVFGMQLKGTLNTICDQCTASIQLPLLNEIELIVKHNETESDDDEVVFIHPSSTHFNLAKYLYEFAVISLPIVNRYDCENDLPLPCNLDVINKLNEIADHNDNSGIWDALKELK
jgi:uncharacterized protein